MDLVVDWGFSWAVVITGLVVVFVVLIILVMVCMAMGKTFETMDKNKEQKKTNNNQTVLKSESYVKPQGGVATIEMVQDGISDDVIAAIAAAISVMMSEDGIHKPFAVKSIKRARETRSAWNIAGIQDNTRPF